MSKLLNELHQLLPTSRCINTDFELTVDAVNLALRASRKEAPMHRVPNFDDGDWTDESLGKVIFKDHLNFHAGIVFVHAPACSRYNVDDFTCKAEELFQFISDYNIEMLFNGDVIFLAPDSSTLTLFHHEGAFAHVQLDKPQFVRADPTGSGR